jgi:hypothetical protein
MLNLLPYFEGKTYNLVRYFFKKEFKKNLEVDMNMLRYPI